MCGGASGTSWDAALVAPRPAPGDAIDPIGLEPVDEVVVTTLVDNVYDALLPDDERTTRASFGVGLAEAPQFEGGETRSGFGPSTASPRW